MAVALTAGVFITERKQGLLDRSLVAGNSKTNFHLYSKSLNSCIFIGVQMPEILLGYLINQFTVMIGQTALVYLVMLLVFKIPCQGNLALAICITLLQGIVGISFGKFYSFIWNLNGIQTICSFHFCTNFKVS